jgi:hypothetical protein
MRSMACRLEVEYNNIEFLQPAVLHAPFTMTRQMFSSYCDEIKHETSSRSSSLRGPSISEQYCDRTESQISIGSTPIQLEASSRPPGYVALAGSSNPTPGPQMKDVRFA